MMLFNDRVRLLRKEKGLKQVEAAQFLEISYRNYQRLEADGEKPQYDTLLKLANAVKEDVNHALHSLPPQLRG